MFKHSNKIIALITISVVALIFFTKRPTLSNPSGFKEPIVTITFDDGYESFYTRSWPTLKKYGFTGTFYITSGFLNTDFFMNDSMVTELKNGGNQISAHTISHPHLRELSNEEVLTEIQVSKKYIQDTFNVDANDFAAPYGEVDDRVIGLIKSNYDTHRGVISGYNNKENFDKYNLLVQNIKVTTELDEFQNWLFEAKKTNSWLILVYHQNDEFGDDYSVTPQNFESQMRLLSLSGIKVLNLDEAINEILPQL